MTSCNDIISIRFQQGILKWVTFAVTHFKRTGFVHGVMAALKAALTFFSPCFNLEKRKYINLHGISQTRNCVERRMKNEEA